jgi:glycosyltransferase involved in cell wall biosynthesis
MTCKVTVLLTTYNHEPFIAQAIEGVLMQETSFNYQLVVNEDCSTDGTREILREYERRYLRMAAVPLTLSTNRGRSNSRRLKIYGCVTSFQAVPRCCGVLLYATFRHGL